VDAAGVIHCYGENWLFSPDMRELESIISKGTIGRPLWMRGREAHGGPHSPWFYDKLLSGGGALLDMGCHVIGVMNALSGQRVKEVVCQASTLYHRTDCDDNALAVLRYDGGLIGQVEASWTTWGGAMVSFEVWGDEGRVTYDRSGPAQPIKVFAKRATDHYFMEKADSDRGWLFPMVEEWWRYGYYDELSHFVDAIRHRRQPRLTFRDGLEVNRIVDAAYRSASEGTWQPVP
jgi:predicted dehydrogenase